MNFILFTMISISQYWKLGGWKIQGHCFGSISEWS